MTSDPGNPWLGTWWVPSVLLVATMATVAGIWTYGGRLEAVSHAASSET